MAALYWCEGYYDDIEMRSLKSNIVNLLDSNKKLIDQNLHLKNQLDTIGSSQEQLLSKESEKSALDLVLNPYKNRYELYLENKGSGAAFDVLVQPYSSDLQQKKIAILGVKGRELLGTLFFDGYDSRKIRIAIYFRDSQSIRYQWEYIIDRFGVKTVLRQHFEKLPDGKMNYRKPVLDFEAGPE